MNRTKIEWCDFSINPVKGLCPMDCKDLEGKPYCYARKLYKRFKWNPELRFVGRMNLLNELLWIPREKPTKIFVGSTFELFGEWVNPEWMKTVFEMVNLFPFFNFIFITKQPQNLAKWSPFPPNCWVGVSITNQEDADKRATELTKVDAVIRFTSIEPMLGEINIAKYLPGWANAGSTFENPEGIERYDLDGSLVNALDWLIIGCQTPMSEKTLPKREWVDEIIEAADKAGIPVFVKEPMATHYNINRKAFPVNGE